MLKRQLHILLIENNPADREMIRIQLQQRDIHSLSETAPQLDYADRLSQGLDRLRRGDIDVVLLDLRLPDSCGVDTLRHVRDQAPNVPVIVLTGADVEQEAIQAIELGAEDYLVKTQVDSHGLNRSLQYARERTERREMEIVLEARHEDLRIAREIQFKLYPRMPMTIDGIMIDARCHPAESVGGDYFDCLSLPGNEIGLVVGDVAGHGLGPALLMAEARACLNTLACTTSDVGEIMTKANTVLSNGMPDNRFITMLMMRIDPITRTLTYANAGHPHGHLINHAGDAMAVMKTSDCPVGVAPNTVYCESDPIQLDTDDVIVAVTDGVLEAAAPNDEIFGLDRLLEIVRTHREQTPRQIIDQLYRSVRDHMATAPSIDDITAMVVKMTD